jgi:hypothetical protein
MLLRSFEEKRIKNRYSDNEIGFEMKSDENKKVYENIESNCFK